MVNSGFIVQIYINTEASYWNMSKILNKKIISDELI